MRACLDFGPRHAAPLPVVQRDLHADPATGGNVKPLLAYLVVFLAFVALVGGMAWFLYHLILVWT